jgi:ElaB/YqjD/DUF883 family membrane-anchored ribosome-binding protein
MQEVKMPSPNNHAHNAAERGHRVVNKAERAAVRGARKVSGAAHNMIETMEEGGEELRHQGEMMMRRLEDHIVERPFTSLAIAAAAGFLLAKIWR